MSPASENEPGNSRAALAADVDVLDAAAAEALLAESLATNVDEPEPDLPPITTVEVDGVTVHHRDSGHNVSGPTYVLVHGLGGSLANWEPVWPYLARLGRVLTPDLAGFGRTEADAGRSAVGDNVDLLSAYLDVVDARNVVLVGNSMGGMISLLLAAKGHPQLERLVLVDAVVPFGPKVRPNPRVGLTFALYMCPPLARFVVPRYVQRRGTDQMGLDGVLVVVADRRRVPRWVWRRAVEEARALTEIQSAVPSLVRAAQSIVIAGASRSYRRALAEVTVPVTFLQGDADALVPARGVRAALARVPEWNYVEAEGVGHVPMFEAATWTAAVIAGRIRGNITNM